MIESRVFIYEKKKKNQYEVREIIRNIAAESFSEKLMVVISHIYNVSLLIIDILRE